jgi:hypothetical protein
MQRMHSIVALAEQRLQQANSMELSGLSEYCADSALQSVCQPCMTSHITSLV